jgi:hypothetical protein
VAPSAPPPPPGQFTPGYLFSRFAALSYRALYALVDTQIQFDAKFVQGFFAGFWDGAKGDGQFVLMLAHPIQTAHMMYDLMQKMRSEWKQTDFRQLRADLFQAANGVQLPTIDETIALGVTGAYYLGYFTGFIVEQIVLTLAITAVTAGAGIVVKVAQVIKFPKWVLSISARIMAILRSIGLFIEEAAKAGAGTAAARNLMTFMRASGESLEKLWAKYPQGAAVVKRLGQAYQRSEVVATAALKWLTIVNRMSDAAAARFITFFESKSAPVAERWLARWTSGRLSNGMKAVRDTFEGSEQAGTASESVHHFLVVTADLNVEGRANLAKLLGDKYAAAGDRLEKIAGRLVHDVDDVRYDNVLGQTGEFLADPIVPVFSEEGAEGLAKVLLKECSL